jgi:molybdopterin-containing oxidoreductase family membrane subunit
MKSETEQTFGEIRDAFKGLLEVIFVGRKSYYVWMTFLTSLMLIGFAAYLSQMRDGLVITNMREQVSWGFYISNFTFLVGVAAAAVLLVIPAGCNGRRYGAPLCLCRPR